MATQTVPTAAPPDSPPPRRRRRGRVVLALVLVLVLGVVATRGWWGRPDDIRSGTRVVDAEGMAARWGIDVSLIAVTAAGGLIEFRYQVVDPDKADPLLHDDELLPAMIVEETGETLRLPSPPHHHGADIKLGGTYFFLFANAHNAVKPGSKITLILGDVRLEHIEAQG